MLIRKSSVGQFDMGFCVHFSLIVDVLSVYARPPDGAECRCPRCVYRPPPPVVTGPLPILARRQVLGKVPGAEVK